LNTEIILIGPIGAGKSTRGKLLSEKLTLPRCAMDEVRFRYYQEVGYDEALAGQIQQRDGFLGLYRYWKTFEIHAVERVLADHRHCVIDFGAGHSVYEDEALFAHAQRALAPYKNVVLLLPSPDLDESVRLLKERAGGFEPVRNLRTGAQGWIRNHRPTDPGFDFAEYFVKHPSNHAVAKLVVYTRGQTPEETRDEILGRVGSARAE
jgi:shikimate kinase